MSENKKGKAYGHRSSDSNYFPTPYSMTEQLFEVEKFNKRKTVLEPAAGFGDMVNILWRHFHCDKVSFYDLKPQHRDVPTGNFYEENRKFDYIITNPPYGKDADKFVMKSKMICKKKFALLLRTNFLSGESRLQNRVYDGFKDVYVFSRMPDFRSPIRDDGKYKSAMNVYAWMVWEIGYKGPWKWHHISNQKYILNKEDLINGNRISRK